jgi:hypothetical protein
MSLLTIRSLVHLVLADPDLPMQFAFTTALHTSAT